MVVPKIDPAKTHQALEHKHERPLIACRHDPTGRYVFFGAEDNFVHRFDIAAKTSIPLAAHGSWVRAIGFSPSGDLAYSGGYDGRLVWWPAADEKRFDRIGWASDLRTARRLAAEHNRPLFLFTMDGRVNLGRC